MMMKDNLNKIIINIFSQTSEIYVDAFNGGGLLNQGECVTKFMHNFADPPVDRLFQVADERHVCGFKLVLIKIILLLSKTL